MSNSYEWYSQLTKPSFAPPSWLFGPVWSVLYTIIFATYGYTVYLVIKKELPQYVLIPMILNLVSNLLFTPLQFGLQSNILAAIDITVVLGTLVWFIIVMYPHLKAIALAQIPYFLWVSFATILQLSITWLNK